MEYKKIYADYQEKNEALNRQIFKKFIDIFKRETKLNIDNLLVAYQVDTSDPAVEFYFLKWVLFNYNQKLIPYFYELLESFGYDMFSEVIDTMNLIGKDSVSSIDPDIVRYAMLSPYINGITVEQGATPNVTVHSEELGDFGFIPIRMYLHENTGALHLINKYMTTRFCHQMSWELMNHFDKCRLVTSLLPSYFEGVHYHTVFRDHQDMIIDAAIEAVYQEETRDMLFKPQDICETEKDDLEAKLEEAIKYKDKEETFPNAVLLALCEQSKRLSL